MIKLMIIEDDFVQAQMMREFFCKKENIEVTAVVHDGSSALFEIKRAKPDVIILDIIMPSIDGYSLLEKLSVERRLPSTIVTTAMSYEGIINKVTVLGAKYLMIKPIDFESLYRRVCGVYEFETGQRGYLTEVKSVSPEEKITNLFLSIGMPAHIKGYHHLREAILLTMENKEYLNHITKELYPAVARTFSTTPSKVERAIRHAIDVTWARGRLDEINRIFGAEIYTNNIKPTNSEFIALIADKLSVGFGVDFGAMSVKARYTPKSEANM